MNTHKYTDTLEYLEWMCGDVRSDIESLIKRISRMESHIKIMILTDKQGEQNEKII